MSTIQFILSSIGFVAAIYLIRFKTIPLGGKIAIFIIAFINFSNAGISCYERVQLQKRSAMIGKLEVPGKAEAEPGDSTDSDSIKVVMGSVNLILVGHNFTDGRPVMPLRHLTRSINYPLLRNYPFVLRMTANGLLLSAKFRSFDDKMVVEIAENEWTVHQGTFLKRNYDKNAVEVIDEYGFPVVQVELIDGWILRLGGYLFEGNQMCIFADGVNIELRPKDSIELVKILESTGLRPWFAYPSDRHFGERVKQG